MRYVVIILTALLTAFCFIKSQAQGDCVSVFGTNKDTCWSKTAGYLWLPVYADGDSTGNVAAFDAQGKVYKISLPQGADSTVFPTQYQLDTAKDNIRGEIAAIPTPTLQTVTDAGDSSDNTLYVGGLNIYGFERPPGQFDGGAAIYIRREQYTGGPIDTAFGNSIHGYMERSVLSIGNNKSYASFDAIPAIYSDSVMNMSAMTGFQNNSIWDYPVGSILDKMYGFNSVLVPKTGTVNNIYDFYAHHLDATGSPATIGDHYAFYSEDFAGANTATRNHGIYLYGTASDNYFAGNVGIGDTNRGSYKLEVNGASNLNGATVVGGTLTLNSVAGGTEDSALALNASNQVIKVPMASTTPTLAQVTTAGATTTNSVTVGTLTVDDPSSTDYSALDFSGGLPRLVLFNGGIAQGNLTIDAGGRFDFDRAVDVNGNLVVTGNLQLTSAGLISGNNASSQAGSVSLWSAAGTSPFVELARAGVARDWHIGALAANGNLVFNSAPSTSANISGTTVITLEKASGELGIGNSSPSAKLHVTGSTGYNQVRMETSYTPTSTADANGSTGDIAWDADYIYIKTAAGWKRAALTTW